MSTTTIVVILIIGFAIYWILIRDGQFKEGLGKFMKKDYHGAIQHFTKTLSKNPDHKQAHFYLGMSYKQISEEGGQYSDKFKQYAVENFIRSSNGDKYNGRANNMVELIICSEQNDNLRNHLIDVAKRQIENSKPTLKTHYFWLYNF